MDYREVVSDTYIWTEIDLDCFPKDDYANRQVRAVFRVMRINPVLISKLEKFN